MLLTVELKESENQLKDLITKACAKIINKAIQEAIPNIEKELGIIIERAIKSTPEYDSLESGTLKAQMGLINGEVMMKSIIEKVKTNILVHYNPFPSHTVLNIGFVQFDHQDILSLPTASYLSNDYRIDWLDWLLTRGDAPIQEIKNYRIKYGDFDRSRSKMAIMVSEDGGSYSVVPSHYSGIYGDNFITRAFEGADDVIMDIIKRNIMAGIK